MACTYEPKDPKSNPLGVSKKMSKEELAAIIADKWKELDITIDKKAKYSAAISTHRYKSKFKPFLGSKNESLSLDGANQNEVNAIALDLVKDAIKHGTLELLIADTRDSSVMSGLLKIAIAVNAYGEYAGEILEALQKNDTKTLEKYKYITEAVKDYARQAGSELGMFRTVYSDPMGELARILEDYDAIFEPVNEATDTTETKAQKKNISSISKKVKEGLTDVDIDIDKVVKGVTPSSPQKRKSVKVEEAKLALKDIFAAAKAKRDAANKGTLSASIIGLTDADIEYIGTIIKESIKFGIKHPKALIQIVIDNYDDQILSDEAKEYIRADIENQIAESKYNDNVTRLKNKIANLRAKIENVGKPATPTTKKEGVKPTLSNEELELIKTIDELKEVYKTEQKRVNNEKLTEELIADLETINSNIEKAKLGEDVEIEKKEIKLKAELSDLGKLKESVRKAKAELKKLVENNSPDSKLTKSLIDKIAELKAKIEGVEDLETEVDKSKAKQRVLTDYQKELTAEISALRDKIKENYRLETLEGQLQKEIDVLNTGVRNKPEPKDKKIESEKIEAKKKEIADVKQKIKDNKAAIALSAKISAANAKLQERKLLLNQLEAGIKIDIAKKETKKKVLSDEETEIKKEIDEVNEKIKEAKKSNTKTDSLIKAKEKLQKELKIATNGKTEVDDSISEAKEEKQKLTEYQQELAAEIDEIKSEISDRKQENALEKQLQKQLDILNDRAIEELKKSSKKLTNKSIEIKKDIENVKKLIKEKKAEAKAKKENSLEHHIKEEAKKLAKSFDVKNVANDDALKDFVKRVAKLYRQKNVSTAPNVNTLDTKEAYLDYLEEQDSKEVDKLEDYVADFKAALNDSSESIQDSIVDQAVDEIMANEKLTDQQKQDALVTIYDKFGAIYKNNIPDKAILDFIKLKLTIPLSKVAKMDNPSIKSQLDDLREELSLYFDGADYTNMMDQVEDRLYAEIKNQGIKNLKEQLKRENIKKFGTDKIKRSKVKFAEQKLVDLIWQGALNDSSLNNLVASALGHNVLDQESRAELLKEALLLREYTGAWANRAKQEFTQKLQRIKNKAKILSGEAKWYQREQDLNIISGLMSITLVNYLSGVNTAIIAAGATYNSIVNKRLELDYLNKGLNVRGYNLDKKNLLATTIRAVNLPSRIYNYGKAHIDTISSLIANRKLVKGLSMQAFKDGFIELEGDIEANRDSNFFDRVTKGEFNVKAKNIKDPVKAALFLASYLPVLSTRNLILVDIAAHAATREFYLNYEMYQSILNLDEESAENATIDLLAKAYNDIDTGTAQEVATAEYKALKEGYSIPHKDFLDIFEKVMEDLPEGEDPMDIIREEILARGGDNKSKSKTVLNDTIKKRISELSKSAYAEAFKEAMNEYNEYNEKGIPVKKSTAYVRALELQGQILNAEAEADAARERTRRDTEQNDPVGSLGVIYNAFEGIRKIGGLAAHFTLFMRSIINSSNKALDYALIGFWRAAYGSSILGRSKDENNENVPTRYTQEQRLSSYNRALTGVMIASYLAVAGSEDDEEDKDKNPIIQFFRENLYIEISGGKHTAGTLKPTKRETLANLSLSRNEISKYMLEINLGPLKWKIRPGHFGFGALLKAIGEGKDFETYRAEGDKILSKTEFATIVVLSYLTNLADESLRGLLKGVSKHSVAGTIGNTFGSINPLNAALYKDAVKSFKVLTNQGTDEPAIKLGDNETDYMMKKFWLGMSNNTIYGMSNKEGYDFLGRKILLDPSSLPFNGGFGLLSWAANRKEENEKSKFKNIDKYQNEGKANFVQNQNLTAPDLFLTKKEKEEIFKNKEDGEYDKKLHEYYANELVKRENKWMNIKSKTERQKYIDDIWTVSQAKFSFTNSTITITDEAIAIKKKNQEEYIKTKLQLGEIYAELGEPEKLKTPVK